MLSELLAKGDVGGVRSGHNSNRHRALPGSDALARTKNRHEEEVLRARLSWLESQRQFLKEQLEKERKLLVEARKRTLRTSGRSPVVFSVCLEKQWSSNTQALLKHLRKPWAVCLTETSYNVVYNDDFDPYMCSSRSTHRQRVALPRRSCQSAPPGQGLAHVLSGGNTYRPMTAVRYLSGQRGNDTKHMNRWVAGEGNCALNDHVTCIGNSPNSLQLLHRFGKTAADDDVLRTMSSAFCKQKSNDIKHAEVHAAPIDTDTNTEPVLVTEKIRCRHTIIDCDSPTVMGADADADADAGADADADVYASRSNPLSVNTTPTSAADTTAPCNQHQRLHGMSSHDANPQEAGICTEGVDQAYLIAHLDEEEQTGQNEYVVFKGRKLHNYVKPQDRYKQDPFREARKEKLVHKLGIENPGYLRGCRPMCCDVQSSFPKHARDWALNRLTRDNMTNITVTRRPVVRNADLDRRVKEFCYPCA